MAGSRGIRAGKAFVELGVSDKLTAGLRRAQRRLRAFGAGLRQVGIRMAAVGIAAAAALALMTREFLRTGDQLNKTSRRTGIAVESLSELGFAAEQSGADMEVLEKGVKTMARSINDLGRDLSTQTDAFGDLGLEFKELERLSPEQQFVLIADRLGSVEDASKRAALAAIILGRAGTRLLPMFEGGAKGMEKLRAEARALGLVVSTETARDAAELTDAFNIMRRVVKNVALQIGASLGPMLKDAAERMTRLVVAITGFVKANRAAVVGVAKMTMLILAAGLTLLGLSAIFGIVGAGIGGLITVFGLLTAPIRLVAGLLPLLMSPIGLLVAAVVGLGATWLVMSGKAGAAVAFLRQKFGELSRFVGDAVGAMRDSIAAGDIELAAKILWTSLKVLWLEGSAGLQSVWLDTKNAFVTVAQELFFGAVAAMQQGLAQLETGWIETTAFLRSTWISFTSGFKSTAAKAIAFVSKRLIDLNGLFDRTLDVEVAKGEIDSQLTDELDRITGERDAALAKRERERAQKRRQSSELNELTLAEIGKQFEDAQAALESASSGKIAEAKAALEAARRELDAAIAKAKSQRQALGEDTSAPGGALSDFLGALESGINGAKESARGTFNARAAQSLRADSSMARRTADASEQTARNTKQIASAIRSGGLAFA